MFNKNSISILDPCFIVVFRFFFARIAVYDTCSLLERCIATRSTKLLLTFGKRTFPGLVQHGSLLLSEASMSSTLSSPSPFCCFWLSR
jgi:hypothetical protein